jgi:hypothetical protein
MYETFRELNCIAENIINTRDTIQHKQFSQRSFHPHDMHTERNAFIDFRVDTTQCFKKPETKFCDWNTRHGVCNEIMQNDRLNNGNNSKLFLLSTKSKDKKPQCLHIFTEKPPQYCDIKPFNS